MITFIHRDQHQRSYGEMSWLNCKRMQDTHFERCKIFLLIGTAKIQARFCSKCVRIALSFREMRSECSQEAEIIHVNVCLNDRETNNVISSVLFKVILLIVMIISVDPFPLVVSLYKLVGEC